MKGWRCSPFAVCLLMLFLAVPVSALAAKSVGHVEEGDFSCGGFSLGDSEETMLAAQGTPLFDKEVSVYGIAVRYHIFGKDLEVGVSLRTGKVVDVRIRGENYRGRGGIRRGATPYKIKATYGKGERRRLDGVIYHVYEYPPKSYRRLMLAMDSEETRLDAFRMTSLPLTEEEADAMAEDEEVSNDLAVILAGEKEIDTSAMPKRAPVKIRGLES